MIDAGKVVAALELDTSAFTKGMTSAQALMKTWGNDSYDLTEKLQTTGKVLSELGSKLSTSVTLPIVAAGTAAVNTFTSYDDALRQVRATMSATQEDTEKLDAAAKAAGISTRYSASEAAEALNYLALAGYNADQAIEALPTVLNLAQAGGIELASASDMVTDSMSALGLSMDYLTTFSDQMAVTAQKSNTSISQLGTAILTVGATAANLKGGTAELNAELGILADVGIKSAEGGTHLRNVILALQSPTSDAAALLAQFTNGVYDAEGNMRSLDTIFGELKASMEGMTQAEKDALVSGIFNKTDMAAASSLIEASGERFAELTGYINSADGAMQTMADTMEGGIGGSFRSLSSAIEGLAIEFGENLAPTVQSVADFVTNLTRSFAELDEGTQNTIITVAGIAAAIGPAIIVVGKLTTAMAALATPTGAIVAGLAAAAVGLAALSRTDTDINIGLSDEALRDYDLSEEAEKLSSQRVSVQLEIENAGKSAYEQIVDIMNDGLPETPEEQAAMADSVNQVIDAAAQAIEDNFSEKQKGLDALYSQGLLTKEQYDTATADLTAAANEQKAALTGEAQAVNDYVASLIAANAPMTEEQIAYLQELIDKLTETSKAAADANDAVIAPYRLAYERVAGGYGLEGDTEKAATYIEYQTGQRESAINAAHEVTQAAIAGNLDTETDAAMRETLLAASQADIEAQNAELAQLAEERNRMYAEMLEAWIAQNPSAVSLIGGIHEQSAALAAAQPDANTLTGITEEIRALMQGITESTEALSAQDLSGLQEIMGLWAANSGEEVDLSSTEAMIDAFLRLSESLESCEASAEPVADTLQGVLSEGATEAADAMDASEEAKNAAAHTVDGFISQVAYSGDRLYSSGSSAAAAFLSGFNARLGIKSPSKVMMQNGAYVVEGLVQGIRENTVLAEAAARELGGAVSQGSTQTVASGSGSAAKNITLNLNGAVIRTEEDARSLARRLGAYINQVNYT